MEIKEEPMEVTAEATTSVFSAEYDRSQLPDLLKIYYMWLFPYQKYYEWLCYDEHSFSHREFSFALEDDVYVRYQSYESREGLEEGIKKKQPYKIDIGAIFSHKPKIHKSIQPGNFKAETKELVFDIDMTDYDDIRTCCSEANICLKCWKFMKIAVRIVDRALREDFGFCHILWVYSGRRGVHCWVCDSKARALSQPARSAIAEYLTLVKGGEQQVKKVHLRSPVHPSVKASLTITNKYIKDIIEEQELLETPEQWAKILQLIPTKSIREKLDEEWKETKANSWERWNWMLQEIKNIPLLSEEIKLQYSYPRLDVNVTKGLNHLLKSPLCIHPKTGRVCVPIDVERIDDFDPFQVPTVSRLCYEFETAGTSKGKKGYSNTSLAPYMTVFNKFVTELKKANSMDRKLKSENSIDY